MTTGNTALLGLGLPVEGELDGTWGDVVNDSITSLLDSAVAGTTTLSADADVTLTDTVLAANQARQAIILWTASNGATTRNITAPARSKAYIVINAGTGSIVLRGAGPTTGVTIVSGEKCLAAWNGSDFVKVASSTADGVSTFSGGTTGLTPSIATSGAITLAGTLNVANGGTGAATLTANNVLLGNGTSALQVVAPGTSGNVLTSNGTTWTSAAAGGGGSWIYITQVTGSAASTIDLDSTYTGYDVFVIVGEDIFTNSSSNNLSVQLKLGGSYVSTNYYQAGSVLTSANSTVSSLNNTGGALIQIISGATGPTGSSDRANIVMYVFNPASTSLEKNILWQYSGGYGSNIAFTSGAGGNSTDTSALTGVRFLYGAGQQISGTFRLYGIKNS